MRVLRPDGENRLSESLSELFSSGRRSMLLLASGEVQPHLLEPFATLSELLYGLDRELQLVATDGWPEELWRREWKRLLDDALLPAQARALEQRVSDGRLEVLFVERGRVTGSALTLVDLRRNSGPLSLNTKVAALELLQSARDALTWEPRAMERLVREAREALGIPAGRATTVLALRQSKAEPPPIQSIGQLIEQSLAAPPPKPMPKPKPEEIHTLVEGSCSRCRRRGSALLEPCGRPELGRIGFLELD